MLLTTEHKSRIAMAIMLALYCARPCSTLQASDVVVSELMYNPLGGSDYEFIELFNPGTNTVNLTGATFTEGITYTFGSTLLATNEYVVIASDRTLFLSRYTTTLTLATTAYTGKLANEGERLVLKNAGGSTLLDIRYDSSSEWPEMANGHGSSLLLVDPTSDPDSPTNWYASDEIHGNPGTKGSPAAHDIAINEVLSHTDPPEEDAIELHNRTTNDIDVTGWFLSDDAEVRKKYCITNTTIPAESYAVFYEYQFGTDVLSMATIPFSLDGKRGDQVYLTAADGDSNLTRCVDYVDFGPSDNGVSFGRYPNGSGALVTMNNLTFGTTNPPTLAAFRTGPGAANTTPLVGPIVISEIMYHPPDMAEPPVNNTEDEYIELCNITDDPVDLFHNTYPTNTWKLTSAVSFSFPTNVTIPPHSYVLVIGTTNQPAFRNTYGLSTNVPLYGPWDGALDNDRESIRLRKPDEPEPDFIPYILVDQIDYSDEDGWPVGPDGHGHSLERTTLHHYGNDPTNWHVGVKDGSPGSSNAPPAEFPPTAVIQTDSSVFEQTALALDGSGSFDPEGGLLEYTWQQVSGPTGAFSSTNTETALFTAPAVATNSSCTIELLVTDDRSYTATAHVDVVIANVGILAAGTLTADTHWTAAESPVGIPQDLYIPQGIQLTMEEDTHILLQPSASLFVQGTLEATGRSGQPVRFECLNTNEFWGSLALYGGATGLFSHCLFKQGSQATSDAGDFVSAICAYNSSLTIVESTAEDMDNVCVYAAASDVIFQSNTVRRTGEGINVVRSRALIEDSTFSFVRNGGDAIDVDFAPTPTPEDPHPITRVARNIIWASTGDGIDLGTADPLVDGNIIFHCADKGISLGEGSCPIMMNNLVWGCLHGVVIKDNSNPTILNHTIVENEIGLSSYEKNPGMEGGRGEVINTIIWDNNAGLVLDGRSLLTVKQSIIEGTPFWTGQGNSTGNPGFASSSRLDYRLTNTSIAIDYAATNDAPDHDIVQTPRPQGLSVDLGALESTTTPTDLDRDGVMDDADAFAADPRYSVDLDNDHMPDGWEVIYFGNTNQSSTGDFDGDGHDNRTEYVRGSHPACSGNEDVIINEIHYHALSGDASDEFIELFNRGSNTINMTGWSLTDETIFYFPAGTTLGPNEYLVIAEDVEEMANRFSGPLLGDLSDALGDKAAVVRLTDANHYAIDSVSYDTLPPWDHMADGHGPSLERCATHVESTHATNWQASFVNGGTPGRANSVAEGEIVINEILATPLVVGNDWLELFNRGTGSIDLAGYYLSDDPDNLTQYEIPGPAVVGSSQTIHFTQAMLGFGLGASGDRLLLTDTDGATIVSQVDFGPQQTNVSRGRFPNGQMPWYYYDIPSPGSTNAAPPLYEHVVINEIMYHSLDEEDRYQFIELYNGSGSAVDLSGWNMGDGFQYTFPESTTLAADSYLVVAYDTNQVQTKYGITGVLGPYLDGQLANSGERLLLLDELMNPVDEVVYDDRYPWPRIADGDGPSLELMHPEFDNLTHDAWRASSIDIAGEGTPGAQNSVYATNRTPEYSAIAHYPLLPQAGDSIEFLVRAQDADGATTVALSYQIDGSGTWFSTNMATYAGDSTYFRATIPAPLDTSLILYYITVQDAASNAVVSPPGAPWVTTSDTGNPVTQTYLCMVDTNIYPTNMPVYRLLISSTNWHEFENRSLYSNELLDSALIVGKEIFQHVGFRRRGTIRTSGELRLDLGHRELHGDDELNLGQPDYESEYLSSEFFKKVGFPSYEVRPVRLVRNGTHTSLRMEFESPDEDFIERYYPLHMGENALGKGYQGEVIFGLSATGAIATFKNTPAGPNYEAILESQLDTDQWMDWFATTIAINHWDTLLRSPVIWNLLEYFNPDVQRWQLLPWDVDAGFPHGKAMPIHVEGQADYVDRFITWPKYRRGIYERVAGLLDGPYHKDELYPWFTSVYDWIGWEYDDYQFTMVTGRASYLENHIDTWIGLSFQPQATASQIWTLSSSATFSGTVSTVEIPAMSCTGGISEITFPGAAGDQWSVNVTGLTNGPNTVTVSCIPLTNRDYKADTVFTIHVLSGDFDGDTITDQDEAYLDSDHDGLWDYQDTDSDNDLLPDELEAGDSNPNTPPIDSDGDGTPDCVDPDSDEDHFPDLYETLALTDHLNSNSFLAVHESYLAPQGVHVSWHGHTALTYVVERGDMNTWTVVASNLTGDVSGTNVWEDTQSLTNPADSLILYRIRVE